MILPETTDNGKSPAGLGQVDALFADVFWYIDAMGSKAKHVTVHSVAADVGIDYGMIDPETNDPLPDFYAGILWSQHMGTGGFARYEREPNGASVCPLCSRRHNSGLYKRRLTVILLNLASSSTPTTSVTLSGIEGCGPRRGRNGS